MDKQNERQGVGMMDKAVDAAGGMVGKTKAAMGGGSTSAFVANARRGDLYEIAAGALAAQRARSPEIRAVGLQLIDDHTTSSHQLMSALRMDEANFDEQLPTELDTHRETMLSHLHQATDDQFDELFLSQQKAAHSETLTLFESYASRGDNPQLASFARGTIPALTEHKRMVEALTDARG